MARFLVYSIYGDGMCLAQQLQRQHDVRFFVEHDKGFRQGQGIVNVTRNPRPEKGEIVVFDSVGAQRLGALYRRQGFATIGGYPQEDWELKRMVGTDLMREHGLAVPETHFFKTLPEAKAFLKQQDPNDVWYFKPDGKDVPKHLTFGKRVPMLLRCLDYAAPHLPPQMNGFQLQKQVQGIEVDVCAWVNQTGVVSAEVTIEEKKFGAGNTGPSTGCQSNLVWCIDPKSRLVEQTVGRFTDQLVDEGYCGLIALNCMFGDETYGLEFTMRPGYDSTHA